MFVTLEFCLPSVFFARYPFTPDQPIQEADWEIFLKQTANAIIEQQSPKRLGVFNNFCAIVRKMKTCFLKNIIACWYEFKFKHSYE